MPRHFRKCLISAIACDKEIERERGREREKRERVRHYLSFKRKRKCLRWKNEIR